MEFSLIVVFLLYVLFVGIALHAKAGTDVRVLWLSYS